jgi:tetratricopeptide (TPR) repeat protein
MIRFRWISIVFLALLLLAAGISLHAQNGKSGGTVSHFNASLAFEKQGKYADALKEMEAIASEGKDNYAVNVRLGWLYYENRQYDSSENYYRQAITLSGQKSVEAMLGMTLPLAAKQDWKEVESTYRKLLAVDPQNYTANLRLGQIYLNQGDYARAATNLGSVLDHYPADYEAVLSSAWNDYSLGKTADARKLFERTLMLSPGDTSAQRGLSYLK